MTTHHETVLDVAGMSCPSCVRHIHAALQPLQGIEKVTIQLDEARVRVYHDSTKASANQLIAALREAGYESILAAA
jgi:copper chaperone